MDKAKRTVLVVEDSIAFSHAIQQAFCLKHDYEVIIANTYKQTVELYEKHKDSIFTAITDLILPDAEDGAAVKCFPRKTFLALHLQVILALT